MQVLLLTAFIFFSVHADMYLQSIRGSNNRLDEANRERNNANRLFDSQNNDRGGYNVGKINMYATEEVPISFTLQHGCGSEDVKHCDVILQAMCDPLARDGTTTQRIPDNPANCRNFNCDTDVKFGRHESYEYYQTCTETERNKGLFQASQQPNRGDATRTRQNPGGTRRGYECPEERDYYPYWNPSPWIDLLVYTKDTGKCDMYERESENVKARWYCDVPAEVKTANNMGIGDTPISQEACEALVATSEDGQNVTSAQWTESPPNGFPVPTCLESLPSRPNHLGLVGDETQWTYMWKVPEQLVAPGEAETSCVFRVRYNISEDYDGTAPDSIDLTAIPAGMVAGPNPDNSDFTTVNPSVDNLFSRNQGGGGNANNRPSKLPVWEKYGLTGEENGIIADEDDPLGYRMKNFNDGNNGQNLNDNDGVNIRDYTLRNNPKPDVLGKAYGDDNDFRLRLQLAVNTAQYGRTFQDRSHVSYIMERPEELGNSAIKMVTVSGKRGNIVQTFPGHEYFFMPETTHLRKYDAVHFVWSGSNTNPNNNDGQGKQGTDRHNICPMKDSVYAGDTNPSSYQQTGQGLTDATQVGSLGGSYPAFVKQPEGYSLGEALSDCGAPEMVQKAMGGLDEEILSALCSGRREPGAKHDFGNMEELDDAGTSVSFKPLQVQETGCYSYVSTRNNNFSNRSQKGTLCVDPGDYGEGSAGPDGGTITSDSAWITIPDGAVTQITTIQISSVPSDENKVVSDTYMIEPWEFSTATTDDDGNQAAFTFTIPYSQRALSKAKVEHKNANGEWVEVSNSELVESTDENGNTQTMASTSIWEGGEYRVVDEPNAGAIVAIVLGGLVFLMACLFIIYYRTYKMKPEDQYAVGSVNA